MFAFMLLLAGSCKQEDVLITGNEAPDDPTISNLLKENYVQKTYRNLYGRQPSDSEMTASLQILNAGNCSPDNRNSLLYILFEGEEYRKQLYDIEINDMLNGLTSNEIKQQVIFYQQQLNDPANSHDYYVILDELQKTKLLDALLDSMTAGYVGVLVAHRIIAASPAYDNLTGGGSEWVSSMFKHFLFREPTETEMQNCEEMLDHRTGTIFLNEGSSKDDIVRIFFNSREYFEGQVRTLYLRYLYREPGPEESVSLTAAYQTGLDYVSLQSTILLNAEYLGIN